jgi:hypothetical protein
VQPPKLTSSPCGGHQVPSRHRTQPPCRISSASRPGRQGRRDQTTPPGLVGIGLISRSSLLYAVTTLIANNLQICCTTSLSCNQFYYFRPARYARTSVSRGPAAGHLAKAVA